MSCIAVILESMHVCPMVTGIVPHVGGMIIGPGAPTVLAMEMVVSCVEDELMCVGPPDSIALGVETVIAEGRPVAAMGISVTEHGGDIVLSPAVTILVG